MEGFGLYIRLVWLFVLIITFLMIFLCYFYLSMCRAQERESQSLAFSHLVIDGLETERRRISRELHDTILPLVKEQPLSDLIRSICMELMPPDFSRLSLKDALADLCAKFERHTGIECVFSIEESLDLAVLKPENQLHIYRMVQESLTNAGKHSGAAKTAIVARRNINGSRENILICVSDDGCGIDGMPPPPDREVKKNNSRLYRPEVSPTALGIKSMRQRAAILGAALDFISESGNGLMVRIELPAGLFSSGVTAEKNAESSLA